MLADAPRVIHLTMDYDVYTTPTLEAELEACDDARHVVLDFARVNYIDSTAIEAFIRMRKRRTNANLPEVRFAALSPGLQRLFKIAGLDTTWPWHDNIESAIASFLD